MKKNLVRRSHRHENENIFEDEYHNPKHVDSEVLDIDESDRHSDEYYYDGEILYFDPIT